MIFYVQTISEDVMITRHTKMKLYTVESELTSEQFTIYVNTMLLMKETVNITIN